eukprot:CAMPEP_0170538384 /NCGR_PEP_ID=MMETSP0209-20121228/103278_1 /TAXON_ID=665100 ORGANISM="Litonotus pictus, Strain P1" /NCGR_SAMPLE_ID=MMETSP0209 /ASSEMBLY_ACC=CAM_ASM_000301 /LENGTH=920 /DNA_ID=CAMNT_0010840063 /DNA_START=276 /DNA_END=3038 /DNA_ORIENTATION=-
MFSETANYFNTEAPNSDNTNLDFFNSYLQSKNILLSVLMYMGEIPQERNIVVDKEQMKEFTVFLKNLSNDLFLILNKTISELDIFNSQDKSIVNLKNQISHSILNCLLAWLDLGVPKEIIQTLLSENSQIVNFVFSVSEENMKSHKQCIIFLICEKGNEALTKIILEKVLAMKPLVGSAIENSDLDGITFFLDIFEALCTENLELILEMKNKEIMMIFLELTKVCDENRVIYVCDFWAETIRSILSDKTVSEDPEYLQIIDQAIKSLISKAKWSTDIFIRLNKEKYSELKKDEDFANEENNRFCIKDFLLNVSSIVSFNQLYTAYFQKEVVNVISHLKDDLGNMKSWAIFEALIFCVGCISKRAIVSDASILEEVLLTVIEVPIELTQINRTVTDLIDDVSEILNSLPEFIKLSFQYLIKGLDNPLTKKHCTISLHTLISHNKTYFVDYLDDLIKIYNEKIKERLVEEDYSKDILSAIIELLFYIDNLDSIKSKLVEICEPWVSAVVSTSQVITTVNTSKDSKPEIDTVLLLEQIAVIKAIVSSSYKSIGNLSVPLSSNNNDNSAEEAKAFYSVLAEKRAILSSLFKEFWNSIKLLLQSTNHLIVESSIQLLKFFMRGMKADFNDYIQEFLGITNHLIVESSIQLLKFFMRGMKADFNDYIQEFLGIICKAYSFQPFSSYLYCFEVTLSVVAPNCDEKEFILLKSILDELCKITFGFYLKTPFNYENNPQLTEDIYGMLFRGMKLNPLVVLDSSWFESILTISISNIDLKHPSSALNVVYFLEKVLNFKRNSIIKKLGSEVYNFYFSKVFEIIVKHGETLVYKILNYLQSTPLEMIMDHLVNLSTDVIIQFPNHSKEWFLNCLKLLPENCLTNKEKEKFMVAIGNVIEASMKGGYSEEAEDEIHCYLRLIYKRCLALNYE